MIFKTRDSRTLRQRVLRWVEEKAHHIWLRLHAERREREVVYEKRHTTRYDTLESWNDPVDNGWQKTGEGLFRLFVDPKRSCRPNVSNMDGRGYFNDASFLVIGLRVIVRTSDEALHKRLCAGMKVRFDVANMEQFSFVLEHAESAPRLEKPIMIPCRQNFQAVLEFSPDVANELRALKTKVGPGSGWASICVSLDGVLIREVL